MTAAVGLYELEIAWDGFENKWREFTISVAAKEYVNIRSFTVLHRQHSITGHGNTLIRVTRVNANC